MAVEIKIGNQYGTLQIIGIAGYLGKRPQYKVFCHACKNKYVMAMESVKNMIRKNTGCRRCLDIKNSYNGRFKYY